MEKVRIADKVQKEFDLSATETWELQIPQIVNKHILYLPTGFKIIISPAIYITKNKRVHDKRKGTIKFTGKEGS